jgi:formate dehydrogenase accessory protein FdhD
MKDTPKALIAYPAIRFDGGNRTSFTDQVIQEIPIAMLYNGISHAVMMATAHDLDDFALGFSLSEGIIENVSEFSFVEAVQSEQGISLEMIIPQARCDLLSQRQRHMNVASACGLCGIESLQAAIRAAPSIKTRQRVTADEIHIAVNALCQSQPMNQKSGGVHAAGFVHRHGLLVREDVGRHNALDKLIGAMARQALGDGFLVLSSRASYELIHKSAMAGIAIVVAISAPSSMAIQLAQDCGITLICFARGEQINVYTYPERLV